jgi:hypothetical protein
MMDGEIEANRAPFRTAVDIVSTHPGISKLSAQGIVSEIGRPRRWATQDEVQLFLTLLKMRLDFRRVLLTRLCTYSVTVN